MFKKKESVYTNELQEICMEKWVSAQQLADVVGVSKQTIVRIGDDKYKPSLELAYKIADALECSVEKVFPKVKVGM